MKAQRGPAVPPDGGWGWVVTVASFFNAAAMYGVLKSGGIIYVALMRNMDVSRSQAALIPSVCFSLACILSPLSSSLGTRYSYRCVVFAGGFVAALGIALSVAFMKSYMGFLISYGVITGFGCGLIVIPNIVIIHTYFHKRRSFATGLSMAGGSVGCFVIPPLMEWIIEQYGFHASLLAASAILIHICPSALLFRPLKGPLLKRPQVEQELKEREPMLTAAAEKGKTDIQKSSEIESRLAPSNGTSVETPPKLGLCARCFKVTNIDPTIFHEKYFYLILLATLFYVFMWIGYLTLLPDYATHESTETVSPTNAALLLSYMSIGDVTFRIISGWILDRPWMNRRYAFTFLLFMSSGVLFSYTIHQSYTMLVATSVIFGIFVSGVIILPPILLVDLLGAARFPMAFGIIGGLNGLAILVSGPTLASIRTKTGSYKMCFLIMSISLSLAGILWLVDSIFTRLRSRRPQSTAQA